VSLIVTGIGLISGALQDLGILAFGRVPSGPEGDAGLETLNQLADFLGLDRLLLYAMTRTPLTLTSAQGTYTIGPDGELAIPRPDWIDAAAWVQDGTATDPLEASIAVLDNIQYADWSQKTLDQSIVRAIWYDKRIATDTTGLIKVLPIPSVANSQLVLYTPGGHLATFDLSTNVSVTRGWAFMLRKNLALALAPSFPMATVSRELKWHASESRKAIARATVRIPMQRNDPALVRNPGLFDIDAGRYR